MQLILSTFRRTADWIACAHACTLAAISFRRGKQMAHQPNILDFVINDWFTGEEYLRSLEAKQDRKRPEDRPDPAKEKNSSHRTSGAITRLRSRSH